jgi:prepilin-type processing-associated H-X9-DG protein
MTKKPFWPAHNCVSVVAGAAMVLVIAAILFPVSAGSIRPGPRVLCLSNLKQLTLAELIYASDFDDHLPDSQTWMDRLVPYAKNEDLYHCPDVKKTNPHAYGYAMNCELSGKKGSDIAKPEMAPLVFDSVLLARNATSGFYGFPDPPRHDRNNVAYVDGHVGRIGK